MFKYFLLFSVFVFFNPTASSVYLNTQNCNSGNCQLPNCFCPSIDIPGRLRWDQTPQFIFFTLDASLSKENFNRMGNYSWILNNPNIRDSLGCTIKPSWYAMEKCNFFYSYDFDF